MDTLIGILNGEILNKFFYFFLDTRRKGVIL